MYAQQAAWPQYAQTGVFGEGPFAGKKMGQANVCSPNGVCTGNVCEGCVGNACAGCAHLRMDMTHIAVTTSENQQVTIDMPMQEQKRITVRQQSMVVEDEDFMDMQPSPQPAAVKLSDEEPAKPVIIPKGMSRHPMTATPIPQPK